MAIPALPLNLAPTPSCWKRNHSVIAWAILTLGILSFAISLAFLWRTYHQAAKSGQALVSLSKESQDLKAQSQNIKSRLEAIDVEQELPKWALAERILTERGIPWSRITAELERCLPQDTRLSSIQRLRSKSGFEVKLKGDSRTRQAQTAMMESFRGNPFFSEWILEQEKERDGGGVEFEMLLRISPDPLPYASLPKYGPSKQALPAVARVQPTPKSPASKPVRVQPTSKSPAPQQSASKPVRQVTPHPRSAPVVPIPQPQVSLPPTVASPGANPHDRLNRQRPIPGDRAQRPIAASTEAAAPPPPVMPPEPPPPPEMPETPPDDPPVPEEEEQS